MRLHGAFFAVLVLAGLVPPSNAVAQDMPASRKAASHPYAGHVAEAAHRFGIPEEWIWAVMRVESGGRRTAVSRAGAMGLMQIMPGTWAQLRARHRLGSDPFDQRDNIMAGAAYLRAMYDRYGNASAMLAAYNAGPGRYDQYLRGRPLPAETRAYLARLSSISGSTSGLQVAAASPQDPYAWRRAGLFVRTAGAMVQSSLSSPARTDAASEGARNPQPQHAPDTRGEVATQPIPAQSDSLFVRRAGAGRPQ